MKIHRTTLYAAICGLVLTGCAASAASISEADRNAMHSTVDNFTKAILSGDFAWNSDLPLPK
jgi:hypothetical protein